jgi:hypothetical protein
MYRAIGAVGIALLVALPSAHADKLTQQVAGVWTLTSGSEQMPDGTRVVPWSAGELILDPSGHIAFFVFGSDRPTSEATPDPRVPAGPMIAFYGTFTTDEDAKTLTYRIEYGSAPRLGGLTRTWSLTLNGDSMVTKASPVKTPQGEVTPINEWRRLK